MMKYKCPCCGFYTYDEQPDGSYEICPVCFWEDDLIQLNDENTEGGATNGDAELYGLDSDGNYFNVPFIMDEDDVRALGADMNLLPDRINALWR